LFSLIFGYKLGG